MKRIVANGILNTVQHRSLKILHDMGVPVLIKTSDDDRVQYVLNLANDPEDKNRRFMLAMIDRVDGRYEVGFWITWQLNDGSEAFGIWAFGWWEDIDDFGTIMGSASGRYDTFEQAHDAMLVDLATMALYGQLDTVF